MTHAEKKAQQLAAMERARFGATKQEIFAQKGAKCTNCGSTQDLIIDHKSGGGRHATEMGLVVPGKTHNMNNLQVMCRSCAGRKDAIRGNMGLGMPGNPNNPA